MKRVRHYVLEIALVAAALLISLVGFWNIFLGPMLIRSLITSFISRQLSSGSACCWPSSSSSSNAAISRTGKSGLPCWSPVRCW